MDAGALSELIKAKVVSLLQEHLKPIVDELAAQRRMLQTHSALLKHNHNVNDYQMGRLENLRDLEQSINFKVAGALGFDPWQHPTMGTNLREPVPADPRLIPRFAPESTTPTQRAAESAELIAQAGASARRLGVPLTLQDFPRDPAIHSGGENEDPMHSAVPLFGIRAPRWRAKEGLPPDTKPGLATYNGVAAPPAGKKGKRLYAKRVQKLKPQKKLKHKWKSFEDATAPIGSSSGSGTLFTDLLLDELALAGSSSSSSAKVATSGDASVSGVTRTPESPGRETTVLPTSSTPIAAPAPPVSTSTSTISPVPSPVPPPPHTTIPALIPSPTPIPTATPIVLEGATPSLTVEPRIPSTSTEKSDITNAASSNSRSTGPSDSQHKSATPTPTAPCPASTPTIPVSTLKRKRTVAEPEKKDAGPVAMVAPPPPTRNPESQIKQEEPEPEQPPQRKRRRRSAAPSPSPGIGLGGATGGGWPEPGQLRRSTRVARAHAVATAGTATVTIASRKRQTTGNGKRATTRS